MSNPWDNDIVLPNGKMVCRPHRREVCHVCCCDHRFCNEMMAGDNVDQDELNEKMDRLQEAEHRAMAQQFAAEGGRGPLVLGGEESERLYAAVAASPDQQHCAQCGTRSDKLSMCSRCQDARYCSKECQVQHFPSHKGPCKAAAKKKKQII